MKLKPLTTWRPAVVKDLPGTGNGEPAAWRRVEGNQPAYVDLLEVVYADGMGGAYRALLYRDTAQYAVDRIREEKGAEYARFTVDALNQAVILRAQSRYFTAAEGFAEWKRRCEQHKAGSQPPYPDFID